MNNDLFELKAPPYYRVLDFADNMREARWDIVGEALRKMEQEFCKVDKRIFYATQECGIAQPEDWPTEPHKCKCNIIDLMKQGCTCKGI